MRQARENGHGKLKRRKKNWKTLVVVVIEALQLDVVLPGHLPHDPGQGHELGEMWTCEA